MYSKDDIIMYSAEGVCKITDITKQDVNGKKVDYYVLKPIYSNTALIYVPVTNESLTGKMHRVLSKEEILTLIRNLRNTETQWIENENLRKVKYKEILSSGDRCKIIEMIKTIHIHKNYLNERGRKLHITDERFLKDSEKILYEEFSFVLDIKPEEVLPFIKSELGINE